MLPIEIGKQFRNLLLVLPGNEITKLRGNYCCTLTKAVIFSTEIMRSIGAQLTTVSLVLYVMCHRDVSESGQRDN